MKSHPEVPKKGQDMTEDNNMQQKVSAQTEQSIPDAEVSVNNTSTGQSPEQVQQFAKQIAELLQPQLTEAQRQIGRAHV